MQAILKNENGEYYGQILDFGAGHSVYEDEEELENVRRLMEGFRHVFLFTPCEDAVEGLRITEERRGHSLELNEFFFKHKSNKVFAKHTIYTRDRSPEECLEEVVGVLKGSGWVFEDRIDA